MCNLCAIRAVALIQLDFQSLLLRFRNGGWLHLRAGVVPGLDGKLDN